MRVYGINGKGYGKSGSKVYSINHGVMIEREYNGSISNPNTPAQVTQRSRFKLASQVSADLAPVIVIPRKGIQSPRNLFVKKNMGYFYGTSEGAQVTYENLQITAGCIGLPGIDANRETEDKLTLSLREVVLGTIDHVVYNVFLKLDNGSLLPAASAVVDVDSDNDSALVDIDDIAGDIVIYAYGIREKNAKAHAIYGNCVIESGTDVATLVANRTIEPDNFQFSATRGTSMRAGDTHSVSPQTGKALVYVTPTTGGTFTVKDNQNNDIDFTNGYAQITLGSTIKLIASPNSGFWFNGWFDNGSQTPLSNISPFEIQVNGLLDIVCAFSYSGGLE